MKYFIKLGILGLGFALTLTACKYQNEEDFLRVNEKQNTIGLVLGDSHISYIYNVKKPQDIYLYAPSGYKILIGNEKKEYYKKHINPQETMNVKFKILKEGEEISRAEEINKLVITFKEELNPSYQQAIMHTGKSTYREGDKNYFKIVNAKQKDVLIELHEYNRNEKHNFYYSGVKNDIRLKLMAPKYHAFIFDGKPVKEYTFKMKKDSEVAFSMRLKADWANKDDTYSRQYRIKLSN